MGTRAVVADIVTKAICGLDLKYPEVTAEQEKLSNEALEARHGIVRLKFGSVGRPS